jgi:hypothetical protein
MHWRQRGAQCGGSTAAAVDHAAQRISNIHRRFAELQQPKPQRIEAVRRCARRGALVLAGQNNFFPLLCSSYSIFFYVFRGRLAVRN